MSKGVPTGLWSRSRSVLALTAGVAGHELRHKVRARLASADKLGLSELRARVEQAKLVAESLGRLKGAFMRAGQIGLSNHDAIAAAKAGVLGLALASAATYAPRNVRINVVAPGLVRTKLSARIVENEASRKTSEATHPLGRGSPGRSSVSTAASARCARGSHWLQPDETD